MLPVDSPDFWLFPLPEISLASLFIYAILHFPVLLAVVVLAGVRGENVGWRAGICFAVLLGVMTAWKSWADFIRLERLSDPQTAAQFNNPVLPEPLFLMLGIIALICLTLFVGLAVFPMGPFSTQPKPWATRWGRPLNLIAIMILIYPALYMSTYSVFIPQHKSVVSTVGIWAIQACCVTGLFWAVGGIGVAVAHRVWVNRVFRGLSVAAIVLLF